MSTFIKPQIKSVGAERISHIVVFDEGSDEPRKVLKTTYESNITPTQTAKVYAAMLSQESTDAPTAVIVSDTLGTTVTWEYVSTGVYRTASLGAIGLTSLVTGASKDGIIHFYKAGARIFVESRDYTGTLSDNILSGVSIRIESY